MTVTSNPEEVALPVAVEGKHIQVLVADHDCVSDIPRLTVELHGCVSLLDQSVADVSWCFGMSE